MAQLAQLGLHTVVPVSAWRRDQPWRIRSVQWFLFFTLFPLFLVGWTAVTGSDFGDVTYLFAIYFAMTWGLVIWLFVRPEKIGLLERLGDAKEGIESWRRDYNARRPHSALGNATPDAFAASLGIEASM